MAYFNIVAQSSESTVVTEYKPQTKRSEAYQSETELEREFIRLLQELGYEYLPIHKVKDLVDNLRLQLEAVNGYRFSDGEWAAFSARCWQTRKAASWKRLVSFRRTLCRCCAGTTAAAKISRCSIKRTFTTTACRSSTSMPFPKRKALPTTTAMM